MKIPTQIQVAGITYTVQIKESECPELDYGLSNGRCSKQVSTIVLNSQLTQQNQELTFLHELTHVILSTLDLNNIETKLDERFVESFSQILYQVIQQI